MSSFPKTRHFPTLSGSNKMKSFESYPSCVGEVPAACRFERKARLRLSGRNIAESTALFSCYFRNSTFDLFIFSKTSQCNSHTHLSAFIRAEGLIPQRSASGCLFAAVFFYLQNHCYLKFSAEKLAAG